MKKTLLILAVLAAAGAVYYFFLRKKPTAEDLQTAKDAAAGDKPGQTQPDGQGDDFTPDAVKIDTVLSLIEVTPGWKDYLTTQAKNHKICQRKTLLNALLKGSLAEKCWKNPITYQEMAYLEAVRQIKKRGFKDIQNRPGDYKKYPRPNDKPDYRDNLIPKK